MKKKANWDALMRAVISDEEEDWDVIWDGFKEFVKKTKGEDFAALLEDVIDDETIKRDMKRKTREKVLQKLQKKNKQE
jgi:hypothetical protein